MNETLPKGAGGERGKGQFQSRIMYAVTDGPLDVSVEDTLP